MTTGCHVNQQLDLVFVVDSSSSLSQDDFNRALYFVDQVASGFKISPTDTQVALITYSSVVRVEFYLKTYRLDSDFILSLSLSLSLSRNSH